jgi:hypothetical protein
MKFSMKDLNPGAWFNFDDNDPDTGKILVRVLNSEKLAEIRNETIKTNVEYRKDKRFEFQEIDHSARDRIIWDYCIIDWKELVDDDDNAIECTTDNKIKLMNEHIGFSLFVETCFDKINAQSEKLAEYSEKN